MCARIVTVSRRTGVEIPHSLGSLSEPDDAFDDLATDPAVIVGVWADSTLVRRGPTIFTVDFIRHVPDPVRRVLVARAMIPPNIALDLRDQIDSAWREYTRWSMPEDDQ